MNQFVAFPFFMLFAVANAMVILKLKAPDRILLSAAIISAPWSGGLWIGPVQFDLRITYIFLFIAFALTVGKSQRFKNKIPYSIVVPTFCWIFWATMSAAQAYNPAAALGGGAVTFLFNFLYLFTIVKAVKKESDVDYILKSLFLGLFYTSVLALLQYKMRFFHIGFVDRGFTTFMWWRTRSTFHHANAYGMYQMLILPILFRQILILFRSKNKKLTRIYIALFLISLFTFYTTSNRGSWVGLVFGLMATIGIDFFRRGAKKTRKMMVRFLILFCVLSIFPLIRYGPRIHERLFEGEDGITRKSKSRAEYNVDAFTQIKAHPILGVGIGNLGYYSSVIFTHNLYIYMIASVGFPGFAFFLWYLFGFLKESRRGSKAKNTYVANMGAGFMATLLALLLASYPGPDYGITSKVSSQIWIIAGVIISLNRMYKRAIMFQNLKKRQQQINQDNYKEADATESSSTDFKVVKY